MQIQVTFPDNEQYGNLAGKTATIPAEALSLDGKYVSVDSLENTHVPKENVATTIQTRLDQQATNIKSGLINDVGFVRQVLNSKGIEIGEDGNVVKAAGMTDDQINTKVEEMLGQRKADWQNEVKDDLGALPGLRTSNEDLSQRLLHAEIEIAARESGVLSEHFEVLPGAPRKSMSIISQTEHLYGKDEHGQWSLKGEGGVFTPSAKKEAGRPNAGPAQFFRELKTNEEIAPRWFGDGKPGKQQNVSTPNGTDDAGKSISKDQDGLLERRKNLRSLQTSQF
tara:strand:- start:366 stop:1208 length:843 start_codon:yes stop_codon:yes gene_type:complete